MKIDNNRLTLLTDELKERNRFLERKYASLIERCGASQEDLEAVEVMMASGHNPILKQNKNRYSRDIA